MQTDKERIQGLWRVTSCVARGGLVSGASHYLFDGNRVKAIYPMLVDGGSWQTYELDPGVQPKRFTETSETVGRDGETFRRIDRWLYDLEEDTLWLCWPNVFGNYPDVISEQKHGVITLARDTGPLPETKRSSGKMPVDAPDIGRLTWDDNFDWWQGQSEVNPGLIAEVNVTPAEGQDDTVAIAALQSFLVWFRSHEPEAREFAADQLLENYNDNWNDGSPISVKTFMNLLKLESVSVNPDSGAELYYEDGDLFAGHCIIVSMDEQRRFQDAGIAG